MGRIAELVAPITVQPGERIGPYIVREAIGEGGFGVVYLAEQTEPIRRPVALKVVKPGMDTGEVLARFEAERQALALMDHPNVARVYEAGVSLQGRPYFAMEYVPGRTITRYADEERLTIRQRLELFLHVCQAVQHAHQKGIIHRDLKPSNILVTLVDGEGAPQVIDFGIAKATREPLTERTIHTVGGRLLGTPDYMSPEQAGPNSFDVDTRTDIYSLGVILYELVTGSRPFETATLRDSGYDAVIKMIRETEPSRPSTRLGESPTPGDIAGRRRTDPRTLARELRGDLDWIILKAMDKDRGRRYETANAFALDIRRHLASEPVMAGPPSAVYRFSKFAKRNKATLLAATAIGAAVVVGMVLAAYGVIEAMRERDAARAAEVRAQTAASEARAQSELATRATAVAQEERDNALAAKTEAERQRMLVERSEAALERERYRLHVAQANLALSRADGVRARAELDLCPKALRRWEWYYLAGRLDESAGVLYWPGRKAQSAVFSRDGTQIICGGRDITVWDSQTLRPVRSFGDVLSDQAQDQYRSLALSPDGTLLLAAQIWDDSVDLWDFPKGTLIGSVKVYEGARAIRNTQNKSQGDVQFSKDGSQFLVSGWVVRTFETATRKPIAEFLHNAYVRAAAYSPDGTLIATAGNDSTLRIWNAKTGEQVRSVMLADAAWSVAFSPDGASIAVGGQTKSSVLMFDVATGQVRQVLVGEGPGTGRVAYSPDGSMIAAASNEGVISIWSSESGSLLRTIIGANTGESGLAFSPDGRRIVTPQWGGYARVWDVTHVKVAKFKPPQESKVQFVSISADGSRLVMLSDAVTLWDYSNPASAKRTVLDPKPGATWYVSVSPDGSRVLTTGSDGSMKLWDGQGTLVKEFPRRRPTIVGAAFSRNAERLACIDYEGRVFVIDPSSESVLFENKIKQPNISFANFSENGELLAVVGQGSVRVWNLTTKAEVFAREVAVGARAAAVTLSPDATSLAAFWENGAGRGWSLTTGEEVLNVPGARGAFAFQSASFSADGSCVAVLGTGIGGANTLRLLDMDGGREIFALDSLRQDRFVAALFLAPDRDRLAAVTIAGDLRTADAGPGRRLEYAAELRDEARRIVNDRLSRVGSTDLNNDLSLVTRDNGTRAMEQVLTGILGDATISEDLRRASRT